MVVFSLNIMLDNPSLILYEDSQIYDLISLTRKALKDCLRSMSNALMCEIIMKKSEKILPIIKDSKIPEDFGYIINILYTNSDLYEENEV